MKNFLVKTLIVAILCANCLIITATAGTHSTTQSAPVYQSVNISSAITSANGSTIIPFCNEPFVRVRN